GIQPQPDLPKAMRRLGYRSHTLGDMTAARMFNRFIWNPDSKVQHTQRTTRPPYFSIVPGGTVGKVWKCSGSCTSLTAFHSGSHIGCHIGSMSHEQESSSPLMPILATRWISFTASSMSP